MALGILLAIVGIWIVVNAINGNFANVIAGNSRVAL